MKKKTQPKNTKKRTKAGENGFSYKLEALGIVYAALGLFMAVSLWYPEVGFLGDSAHYFLTMGLGRGALLLPIYLVILGLGYVVNHKRLQFSKRFFSILLFLVSLLSLWHASVIPEGAKSCQNHYLSVAASLEAPSCLFSQRLQAVLGPLFCSLP